MPHVEIVQNGVVIVKPSPRLRRAIQVAQQFLGRMAKSVPGIRTLIRHELMLQWLHRQIHDFAVRQRYRGKAVYVALDEKILSGAKDLASLVREHAQHFLPIDQLESGIRNAFSVIAREKIRGEWKKKIKKKVQTYGEPWSHRANK